MNDESCIEDASSFSFGDRNSFLFRHQDSLLGSEQRGFPLYGVPCFMFTFVVFYYICLFCCVNPQYYSDQCFCSPYDEIEEMDSDVSSLDPKVNATNSFAQPSPIVSSIPSFIHSSSSLLRYPLNETSTELSHESSSISLVCSWSEKKENQLNSCQVCSLNHSEYLSFPCIDPASTHSRSVDSDFVFPLLPEEISMSLMGVPVADVEDNVFEALSPIHPLEGAAESLKNRIDLASVKAGAVSLAKSKAMNGADAVLTSSRYKYSLAECSKEKWFVFSLAEMVWE